jgi:hypothetical protein
MAPATAATPDPADPPVNTITAGQWEVLLAKRLLATIDQQAGDRAAHFTDLGEVARCLIEERRHDSQDRQRKRAGSN